MKYKYQKEIIDCNLDDYHERENRSAYRFVYKDIEEVKNFLPVNLVSPENSKSYSCIGWALSFFSDQDKAKRRYYALLKNKPMLYKKIGTHLAMGHIQKTDGVSNDEQSSGHFSHYEYIEVELKKSFVILEVLKNIE